MSIGCYVDLHCHILPGVDDGARDAEQAQRMLRIAAEDGIRKIVVTPHNKAERHNVSRATEEKLVSELQAWLDNAKIPIQLYIGNEIMYRHDLSNLLEQRDVCTLADSFYVLVEFSPEDDYPYIRHGIKKLLAAGYYPVVAHIERYETLKKNEKYIEELVDMGAYMQVNAASIEGRLGFLTKAKVIRWIREGLIHFVASDAHSDNNRIPNLSKSARIIEKKCGIETVQELYHDNQQKILENKVIK